MLGRIVLGNIVFNQLVTYDVPDEFQSYSNTYPSLRVRKIKSAVVIKKNKPKIR